MKINIDIEKLKKKILIFIVGKILINIHQGFRDLKCGIILISL